MNNLQIIGAQALQLAAEGLIKYGEDIHTFSEWKRRGFSVKKGEHAVAAFPIWKYTSRTVTDEETGEEETHEHMFLKKSHFFSASQVKPIEA